MTIEPRHTAERDHTSRHVEAVDPVVARSGADLLAAAVRAERDAHAALDDARSLVLEARSVGITWAQVGRAFGVTRQAAMRRWRLEASGGAQGPEGRSAAASGARLRKRHSL